MVAVDDGADDLAVAAHGEENDQGDPKGDLLHDGGLIFEGGVVKGGEGEAHLLADEMGAEKLDAGEDGGEHESDEQADGHFAGDTGDEAEEVVGDVGGVGD